MEDRLHAAALAVSSAEGEQVYEDLARAFAAGRDVVTEGRDQATVVFPNAECKIFLTAGEEERAQRRFLDLQARGEEVDFAEVLRKQRLRDKCDTERAYGGLAKASDSIEVLTDGLSPDQVVDRLAEIVQSVQSHSGIGSN